MARIMLLGPPGSGKGTQAARTTKAYNIPVLATGDVLRDNIAKGTELGKRAKVYMDKGQLVPDEIISEVIRDMFFGADIRNGFLLDGFPRTIGQAERLDNVLTRVGIPLEKVFFLRVPTEVLVSRISQRLTCPACGEAYHMSGKKPTVPGLCDKCASELVHRHDDAPETVTKRIEVYNEQTEPLIAYYGKQGKLIELDGTSDVDTLQGQIDSALKAA